MLGGGLWLLEPLAKQGGECRGEWLARREDSGKHAYSVLGGGSWLLEPLAKQGGECRGEWLGMGEEVTGVRSLLESRRGLIGTPLLFWIDFGIKFASI